MNAVDNFTKFEQYFNVTIQIITPKYGQKCEQKYGQKSEQKENKNMQTCLNLPQTPNWKQTYLKQ